MSKIDLQEIRALTEAVAKLPDDVCTVESAHPVVAKFLAATGVPTILALLDRIEALEEVEGAARLYMNTVNIGDPDGHGKRMDRLDRALAALEKP